MATLLIILLSTVLIQGSAVALAGSASSNAVHARGVLLHEFRTAAFTLLVLTSSTLFGYAASHLWLPKLHLEYLLTPTLLLGVALIFVAARRLLNPSLEILRWPATLAYLTTQCAVLGMALFSATHADGWRDALEYGLGSALSLALLSACFYALRERIDLGDVPKVFRGIPIALITAGFIALALMGFVGMVRN